jgi:hypothetical protein
VRSPIDPCNTVPGGQQRVIDAHGDAQPVQWNSYRNQLFCEPGGQRNGLA